MEDYALAWKKAMESIVQPMEKLSKVFDTTASFQKAYDSILINNEAIFRAFAGIDVGLMIQQREIEKVLENIMPPLEVMKKFSRTYDKIMKDMAVFTEQTRAIENLAQSMRIPLLMEQNISALLYGMTESIISPSKPISFNTDKLSKDEEEELNRLLKRIDPYYVEIRKAVWDAFNSKEDERLSHAMVSMRRLFDFVLEKVGPVQGSRRSRIEETLSKYDDELSKAASDVLVKAYKGLQYLHGEYHKKKIGIDRFRKNVNFYLRSCEWTLLLILGDE